MPRRLLSCLWLLAVLLVCPDLGRAEEEADDAEAETPQETLGAAAFEGLRFRALGPAFMAGRIGDLAVDPGDPSRYFVAACSGGVWRTVDGGTTFEPVFDDQGSYSIGCLAMDPTNPSVIWVGTGENNSQRSVSFGDGVYKSVDGGRSWKNVGLGASEHIGMIAIDPRDPDVVYVAAQGPLWSAGGDRGLYKTVDGGATWERVLDVGEHTGVNEVHLDPRDPDVLYASSYQRRRHVWTLINGGPESGVHKSTDGGATWRAIDEGLPSVDMGRIGLDIAPSRPDTVYAIVEAADEKSGFFRSTDRGESWQRMSGHKTVSPQYYNEIVCDPIDPDRVYALDTFLHVTQDGGKTFARVPRTNRHVDDHALWIDPANTRHMIVGCDGGVYDTWDRGAHWHFKTNLPVTQFYRVAVDDDRPFYNVYGGTQDNNTQGGPSRTRDRAGITNADWFITVGGDGYETQVDPTNPDVVYSQWQYGGLIRYDRRSGERVDIRPRLGPEEAPLRWNWDSPLVLSPHSPTRLYFAANRLFRSDDRGDGWQVISPDLTRQIDRNQLEVMGRVQPEDAVAKDDSTSVYGNCVALCESPVVEGLLYVGTDDGLVQVSEDAGGSWRAVSAFPGVPENTYVSCLTACPHVPDTVYASFDNHKHGDFTPYLLKSTDRGRTWTSVAGDLPERDVVYCVRVDPVQPDLIFAGTEFGCYVTLDGGTKWIRLKGGLPTIAVRDLELQARESDLVLGTFGRGIYILDDYSVLRHVSEAVLEQEAPRLFPVREALQYVESSRLGGRNGKGFQGASFYAAPNPPFGAVFTVHLREKLMTARETRQKQAKDADEAGEAPAYPDMDQLRREDRQREPALFVVVRDSTGAVVKRIGAPRTRGFHRVAWNLRYPSVRPVETRPDDDDENRREPAGVMALPGTYTAQLATLVDGVFTYVGEPEAFDVVPLDLATFAAEDKQRVFAIQKRASDLQRAVVASSRVLGDLEARLGWLGTSALDAPASDAEGLLAQLDAIRGDAADLRVALDGDASLHKRNQAAPRSIGGRIGDALRNMLRVTSAPTRTQREEVDRADALFRPAHEALLALVERVQAVERQLELDDAPWTPGRVPVWPPR